MMKSVKSVGVFSAAKFGAALFGCLAVIVVPAEILLGQAGYHIPGHLDPGLGIFGQIAWHIGRAAAYILVGAISICVDAIYGFLLGSISAFIYNFVARRFGGIEVEVELAPEVPYLPQDAPSVAR